MSLGLGSAEEWSWAQCLDRKADPLLLRAASYGAEGVGRRKEVVPAIRGDGRDLPPTRGHVLLIA